MNTKAAAIMETPAQQIPRNRSTEPKCPSLNIEPCESSASPRPGTGIFLQKPARTLRVPQSPNSERIKTLNMNTVTYSPHSYSPRGHDKSGNGSFISKMKPYRSVQKLKTLAEPSVTRGESGNSVSSCETDVSQAAEIVSSPHSSAYKLVKLQDSKQMKDWFAKFSSAKKNYSNSNLVGIAEASDEEAASQPNTVRSSSQFVQGSLF